MENREYLVVVVILLGLLGFLFLFTPSVQAAETRAAPSFIIGLDLPNIGWAVTGEEGEILGYRGFNLGLGYSSKTYFNPVEYDAVNTYRSFGTLALILPYFGVGADYIMEVGDTSLFQVGGGIGFCLFIPYVTLGASLVF